jgi:hypothetical protein
MLCWCGFGSGGVGDDRFAVADGDVLAGERVELGSEVAGAAMPRPTCTCGIGTATWRHPSGSRDT